MRSTDHDPPPDHLALQQPRIRSGNPALRATGQVPTGPQYNEPPRRIVAPQSPNTGFENDIKYVDFGLNNRVRDMYIDDGGMPRIEANGLSKPQLAHQGGRPPSFSTAPQQFDHGMGPNFGHPGAVPADHNNKAEVSDDLAGKIIDGVLDLQDELDVSTPFTGETDPMISGNCVSPAQKMMRQGFNGVEQQVIQKQGADEEADQKLDVDETSVIKAVEWWENIEKSDLDAHGICDDDDIELHQAAGDAQAQAPMTQSQHETGPVEGSLGGHQIAQNQGYGYGHAANGQVWPPTAPGNPGLYHVSDGYMGMNSSRTPSPTSSPPLSPPCVSPTQIQSLAGGIEEYEPFPRYIQKKEVDVIANTPQPSPPQKKKRGRPQKYPSPEPKGTETVKQARTKETQKRYAGKKRSKEVNRRLFVTALQELRLSDAVWLDVAVLLKAQEKLQPSNREARAKTTYQKDPDPERRKRQNKEAQRKSREATKKEADHFDPDENPMIQILIFLLLCPIATAKWPTANTEYGSIRGEYAEASGQQAEIYISVPYARAPIGELRFEPPKEPENWETVRDATQETSCIQYPGHLLKKLPHESEDCLHLKIVIPLDKKRRRLPEPLPILFWIHGGSFLTGGKHNYNTTDVIKNFSTRKLITVFANYRLGNKGFLSMRNRHFPGNFGLEDVLLGLKFIHEINSAIIITYCNCTETTALEVKECMKKAPPTCFQEAVQLIHDELRHGEMLSKYHELMAMGFTILTPVPDEFIRNEAHETLNQALNWKPPPLLILASTREGHELAKDYLEKVSLETLIDSTISRGTPSANVLRKLLRQRYLPPNNRTGDAAVSSLSRLIIGKALADSHQDALYYSNNSRVYVTLKDYNPKSGEAENFTNLDAAGLFDGPVLNVIADFAKNG
ncbi:unnamed protein product, partial [Mesorhabditis spiculigera]